MVNGFANMCGGVLFSTLPDMWECDCSIAPPLSQIYAVLLLPVGAKTPIDWTDLEQFQAIIDNTDTTNKRGKWLTGIGEIPEPTEVTVTLGNTVTKLARRVYELVFEVEIIDAAHYNFLQRIGSNYTGFNFWYFTMGGRLFGKNAGIRPYYVSCVFPKGRSEDAVEIGILRIRWYADSDPLRTAMPGLAGDGMEEPSTQLNFMIYRQVFPAQASADLIWTENGGDVPSDLPARLWVYHNGQKLEDTVQYIVTPNSGPGQSTITINALTHSAGDNYEVFTFENN